MKKGLMLFAVFLVILGVISTSGAYAQAVCSDPSQEIFSISSQSNAHGEIAGQGNYATSICYNDIFGQLYDPGVGDPHLCDGNNEVLVLSANTNAHAETSGEGNYNSPVCYGDLECIVQGSECSGNYAEVATISANTNAHIETSDANSFNSGFKICCTSPSSGGGGGGTAEITDVKWKNTAGNEITETNLERTVRMYAETTAQDGETVQFFAWDDDDGNGEYDFGDESLFDASLPSTVSNGIATLDFTITQEFIDERGLDDFFDCDDGLEFYFEANILDSEEKTNSSKLTVHCEESGNQPPHANITSPEHRGIYFTNTEIEFNHSSFDDGDAIVSFLWTVYKDGIFEFESNEESFTHIFTTAGQRTITLRVTDEEGLSDEHQISILAIASPGILAYINYPFHNQVIINESLIFGYNADDSYVVESTVTPGRGNNCDYTIKCKAGYCPSKTKNAPQMCSPLESINLDSPLDVGFDDGNLNFTWRFRDEYIDRSFSEIDIVTGKSVFGAASNEFNDKKINLLLKYDDSSLAIQNPTEREFTLLDFRQCIEGGLTWVELDENGFANQTYSTLDNPGACAGKDRLVGSGDDCCPSGMTCTENGCVGSAIDSCSDYTDITSCKNDGAGMGRPPAPNDPLWEEKGCGGEDENGRIVQCACAWEAGENECGLKTTYINGSYSKNDPCIEYQCLYTYDEGECNNGFMELTIQSTFSPGTCGNNELGRSECEADAGTKIVPCGRPIIELPFFGREQFIASLIFITLIYVILKNAKIPGRKNARE